MSNLAIKSRRNQVEILVRGTVQGVGFRPFIYNLASRLKISGNVCNTGEGVVINACAENSILEQFTRAIADETPTLARIDSIVIRTTEPVSELATNEQNKFEILPSPATASARTTIPPDIALCKDCRHELSDPQDRRYQYPFTNCTNCGPRYTIVESIPYDRPHTSMKVFEMCDACSKEYHDPANRRFHAQPNACAECGPQIKFFNSKKIELAADLPIIETIRSFNEDKVVAIRGLGGFHLSVNGCSENAVAKLRRRKQRVDKPLAIMVRDLEHVKNFCHVGPKEIELLTSAEQPIVLLRKKPDTQLAPNLAPKINEIGVMLPYTPLHYLLFNNHECPEALVMTSGNSSGIPICTSNEDAFERLNNIADNFLIHNRDIVTRVDDSVMKVVCEQTMTLRRSRGFVPASIRVNNNLPKVLACGAGLKNTFSLGRGHNIFPSQHIGDLANLESYDFFVESIEHLKAVYQLNPEIIVCDLHPDYPSSRYGKEASNNNLPLYHVQHHHAHGVAVMAEHGLTDPVLAVIFDGTGLGDDGAIWGGEIMKISSTSYERLGHLENLHLPGGDAATTEPWRMGLSALFAAYGSDSLEIDNLPKDLQMLDPNSLSVVKKMISTGFNSPLTSSCGRLFDSIASLLGVRQKINYEGQAAMELEALAKEACPTNLQDLVNRARIDSGIELLQRNNGDIYDKWQIVSTKLITMVIDGLRSGEDRAALALNFHIELICSITKLIELLSRETGISQVVLSGGCMQNSLLLEGFLHSFGECNIEAFSGNFLPVNDGGISIGQTVIGGLQHVSCNPNESNRRSG